MNFPDFPHFADFEDSFTAFIDILGFTPIVRHIQSENDFNSAARILYTLKKEAESYSGANESSLIDVQMTAISDSVIVSIPFRSPVAASVIVTLLHRLQYDLLALTPLRKLVRGYLDRGPLYHRNGLLFGVGYLNAYDGERSNQENHDPPRIVVASRIIDEAKKVTEKHRGDGLGTVIELLRRDGDGVYFIDYLKPVGALEQRSIEERLQEIEDIAAFARTELARYSSEPHVRAKYEWLLHYVDAIRHEWYQA